MNWIVKNFLRGVIIVVPIALTIYLIYEGFTRIDRLLNLPYPGVGFGLTILLMILVGALASNFFVRKFLELTNAIFTRAPLVRLIYAAIRDLLEAFVGDQKRFNQPVAVSLLDGVRTVYLHGRNDRRQGKLSFLREHRHGAAWKRCPAPSRIRPDPLLDIQCLVR